MELYLAHLPDFKADNKEIDLPLSSSEQVYYERIKSPKRQLEWRVSRWLRRYILSQKLAVMPEALVFETTAQWRPYIDSVKNIDFNMSHSGQWLAMIVCEDRVGIDIQICQSKRNLLGIAKQYFLSQEYGTLLTKEDPTALFYQLWTLKEACVKATGEGIASGFPKYGFEVCHGKIRQIIAAQPFVLGLYVFDDMLLSIASKYEQDKMQVQQVFPDGKKKTYTLKRVAST